MRRSYWSVSCTFVRRKVTMTSLRHSSWSEIFYVGNVLPQKKDHGIYTRNVKVNDENRKF